MHARVSRFRDDPANLDDAERYAEEKVVPELETVPGFLGLLSMVDRGTGRSLALTFWETEQAMRASEEAANRVRDDIGEQTGSSVVAVERYEVTLRVGL